MPFARGYDAGSSSPSIDLLPYVRIRAFCCKLETVELRDEVSTSLRLLHC